LRDGQQTVTAFTASYWSNFHDIPNVCMFPWRQKQRNWNASVALVQ